MEMPYLLPPLPVGPLSGYEGLDLASVGVPSVEAARANYYGAGAPSEAMERAAPHAKLFSAVGFFRLAAICQGVYARGKAGNASSANPDAAGSLATLCADVGLRLAREHAG